MKKLFSLFAAVLFAGSMMADVVTLTMSDYAAAEFSAKGISVTTAKNNGSTAPTYNATGKDLRIYAKGSITISAAVNIKAISFEISTAGKKRLAPLTPSVGSASVAGDPDFTATWEGEAKEITLTVGDQAEYGTEGASKAGQLDFTAITVTLGEGGDPEPVQKYYLVGSALGWEAKDANELKANPKQSGEYTIALTVAAGDGLKVLGVKGETQTWYKDGMGNEYVVSDEEAGEVTVYFRPDGNEEWTYNYFTLVPKAPVAKKTCADVYELEKNAEVALNDVVVTIVDKKNVYVRDASAGLLLYLPADATWKVGDVLSGVEGVVTIYNGIYEVKPSADQVAAIVATAGEAPAPEKLTAVDKDKDMSKLILLESVTAVGEFAEGTASNITITLGANTYTLRNYFKNGFKFVDGKKYDVTALVTLYQSNLQLYFISAKVNQATAVENTAVAPKAQKVLRDGQIYIIRDGVMFNANGAAVK